MPDVPTQGRPPVARPALWSHWRLYIRNRLIHVLRHLTSRDLVDAQWLRETCLEDMHSELSRLGPSVLSALEISGTSWRRLPWASHTSLDFPDFDLCHPPAELPGPFDVVICEHVLEHVADPLAATRTLRKLCKPNGHVLVVTPFLVMLHYFPTDYWRFTPDGLALLLRSQGLEPLWVRSWGNRWVVRASFDEWVSRLPWQSRRNEPRLPIVVWSLARPV